MNSTNWLQDVQNVSVITGSCLNLTAKIHQGYSTARDILGP